MPYACAESRRLERRPGTHAGPPLRRSRCLAPASSQGFEVHDDLPLLLFRQIAEGEIGPRQPCPCGSGKRYKACHGAAGGVVDVIVTRPFEGLACECELVALREFVPSATAKLPLRSEEPVTLGTVLPMAAAAVLRADEEAFVGLEGAHEIEYRDVDPDRPFEPLTPSELKLREYQGSPGEISEHMSGVEALVVQGAPVTDAVLDASSVLRLVCCARGGPVNVDVDAVSTRGLPLVNAPRPWDSARCCG